jgi:tRNA-dependent cyclodipeptide synthase
MGSLSNCDGPAAQAISPLTENCRHITEQGYHALVALEAPFPSERSPQQAQNAIRAHTRSHIEALLHCASTQFATFDVLLPGDEAALWLIARGCPPAEAVRRLRLRQGRVRDRCRALIRKLGEVRPYAREPRVYSWTELADQAAYRGLRYEATLHFETDPVFRAAILLCGRAYLTCAGGPAAPRPGQIRMVATWLLDQLPWLLDTPALLDLPSSVLCHHRRHPATESLFLGEFGLRPSPRQGLALITPPETGSGTSAPAMASCATGDVD